MNKISSLFLGSAVCLACLLLTSCDTNSSCCGGQRKSLFGNKRSKTNNGDAKCKSCYCCCGCGFTCGQPNK